MQQNKDLVEQTLSQGDAGIRMLPSDATYLCWLDVHGVTQDDTTFCEDLRVQTGLILSHGSQYGEAGRGFLRVNVGTRRDLAREGLQRLGSIVPRS